MDDPWSAGEDHVEFFATHILRGQGPAFLDRFWDLTGPLPVPRFMPRCSSCGAPDPAKTGRADPRLVPIVRQFSFQKRNPRTGTSHPWRCDVSFKCVCCGLVWTHGLPIPKSMYEKHTNQRFVFRRKAREILGVDDES